MEGLRKFEREAIELLAGPHLSHDALGSVLESSISASIEHTGVGYFLTIRHAAIPSERVVCSTPMLSCMLGERLCGFVVFMESGELALECHQFGDGDLPLDCRSHAGPLKISIQQGEATDRPSTGR